MFEVINVIEWFFLLGFLPGFVLMGLFKLKNINWITGLLYIIGLSLIFDMVVGFAINLICPLFGLVPFSRGVMVPIWLCIMVIFAIFAFIYRKRLISPYQFDNQWIIVLIIYVVSVALIYQTSLLTNNLVGSDIHSEYLYAKESITNGFLDVSTYYLVNICLPITILIPMFSVLSGLDVLWVFKAVQPLVMALLPIILYKMYKLQFGKIVAILSVIFFITLPFFTMDTVQLIRQQYSMIFFALIALVLIDRNISTFAKIVLGSLFGFGVAISHYGVGVGFMCYMVLGIFAIAILKAKWFQGLWEFVCRHKMPLDIAKTTWKSVVIWISVTVLCVGGGLLYYQLAGSGVGITAAAVHPITIFGNTVDTMISAATPKANITDPILVDATPSKVLSPAEVKQRSLDVANRSPILRMAVGFDFAEASTLGKIWRILQYLVELCIIIGLIRFVFRPIQGIRTEFFVFIITSALVALGLYILPTTDFVLGATRVFAITLIFLSPFFVFGVDTITKGIMKLFRIQWKSYFLVIATSIILVPYIVFNSGVVFELIKSDRTDYIDIPFSISLSGYRLDMAAKFDDEDVAAMEWLQDKISNEYPVYGDLHTYSLTTQYEGGWYNNKHKLIEEFCEYGQGYVFLRKWNVNHETLTTSTIYGCRKSIPWLEYTTSYKSECKPMATILEKGVVVFDNGARILRVDK